MKRIIKSIARRVWRALDPLRRPLLRKFTYQVNRSVIPDVEDRLDRHTKVVLGRLEPIEARCKYAEAFVQELSLVLDSMVRELTRLQSQVEGLHERIEELSPGAPLVRFDGGGESDDHEGLGTGGGERSLTVDSGNRWTRKLG
jgi:hypothetical protein